MPQLLRHKPVAWSQEPVADVSPDDMGSQGNSDAEGLGSVYLGTDIAIKELPFREPVVSYGDAVSLNFEGAAR